MRPEGLNDRLLNWSDLEDQEQWAGLLIGNGASQAVWPGFDYQSLYESAVTSRYLSRDCKALFQNLKTSNFEAVLSALNVTETVLSALGETNAHQKVQRRYASIKLALRKSIRETHVPWPKVRPLLPRVYDALLPYQAVFSINYDLIIYWAINECGPEPFVDFFFGRRGFKFSAQDCELRPRSRGVYFLHGGVHLESLTDGRVRKRTSDAGRLLDTFATTKDATPLIVSEGTRRQKASSIRRSPYLTFALSQLSKFSGPLVLFGLAMSDSDKHLMAAINRHTERALAVSVHRDTTASIARFKAAILHDFPGPARVRFFDAATHPLGNSELRAV